MSADKEVISCRGVDVVEQLVSYLGEQEIGASAHWQREHETFSYDGTTFHGLRGFGHHAPPAKGLRGLVHRFLQSRYRKMGAGFDRFDEIDAIAARIALQQDRLFELDLLRQVLSLSQILELVDVSTLRNAKILVVGDGFANMCNLLMQLFPDAKVIAANLTKTLLVDAVYAGQVRGTHQICLLQDVADVRLFLDDDELRFGAVRADFTHILDGAPISLIVNIASMQEMTINIVTAYFRLFRSFTADAVRFYCCNREEKELPDGSLTRFDDYPWDVDDLVLLDELCPWHQDYYSPVPPFYRPYIGPIRHRIVELARH